MSTDICKNNICFFRSPISPWTGPQWKSLFGAFFLSMVYIFTMPKIGLHWGPVQPFLNVDHNFSKNCFLKKLWKNFGTKIWVVTIRKNAKFFVWWGYWVRNKCLLLSTFCTFQTPLTVLTNSAMGLVQVFVSSPGHWSINNQEPCFLLLHALIFLLHHHLLHMNEKAELWIYYNNGPYKYLQKLKFDCSKSRWEN